MEWPIVSFWDGLVSGGVTFFLAIPKTSENDLGESSDVSPFTDRRSSSFHARERRLSAGQEVLKDERILGDAQAAGSRKHHGDLGAARNCWFLKIFLGWNILKCFFSEIMWNAEILWKLAFFLKPHAVAKRSKLKQVKLKLILLRCCFRNLIHLNCRSTSQRIEGIWGEGYKDDRWLDVSGWETVSPLVMPIVRWKWWSKLMNGKVVLTPMKSRCSRNDVNFFGASVVVLVKIQELQ